MTTKDEQEQEQPTTEPSNARLQTAIDELDRNITSGIGEMLELRMEEASLSGSVDSGAFDFRNEKTTFRNNDKTAAGAAMEDSATHLVDTMMADIERQLSNEQQQAAATVSLSSSSGESSSVVNSFLGDVDEVVSRDYVTSEDDDEDSSASEEDDFLAISGRSNDPHSRNKAALLLKQAEAVGEYSKRMRENRVVDDPEEAGPQSTIKTVINATTQLREQANLKYTILETKYLDLKRQFESDVLPNVIVTTQPSSETEDHEHSLESKSQEQHEWTPKKKKICGAITVTLLLLLVGAIVGLIVVMIGQQDNSSISPEEDTDMPLCDNLPEEKQGRFDLILQDVNASEVMERQEEIQDLFLRTYNSASGGCEGLLARVVENVTIQGVETLPSSPWVHTSWTALVHCSDCPDDEPLFHTTQSEVRRRRRRRLQQPQQDLLPVSESSTDMFERFLDTFNRHLISLMDLETIAPVVSLVTLSSDDGEINQVFNAPTTPAPTVSAAPTMAPSSQPSVEPSTSPTSAPTVFTIGPNDAVNFTIRITTNGEPIEAIGNITESGTVINKWFFPAGRKKKVAFEVDASPKVKEHVPGVAVSIKRFGSNWKSAELKGDTWRMPSIRTNDLKPTSGDQVYDLTVTPIWFTNETVTDRGVPYSIQFTVGVLAPTAAPTPAPSSAPTVSAAPTLSPQPTAAPTVSSPPTESPTGVPSMVPTLSASPTIAPSLSPTALVCRIDSFVLVNADTRELLWQVDDGDVIDWNLLHEMGVSNVTMLANTDPQEVALVRWYENGELSTSWGKYLDGVLLDGHLGASELLATPAERLDLKAECDVLLDGTFQETGEFKEVGIQVVAATLAPNSNVTDTVAPSFEDTELTETVAPSFEDTELVFDF